MLLSLSELYTQAELAADIGGISTCAYIIDQDFILCLLRQLQGNLGVRITGYIKIYFIRFLHKALDFCAGNRLIEKSFVLLQFGNVFEGLYLVYITAECKIRLLCLCLQRIISKYKSGIFRNRNQRYF